MSELWKNLTIEIEKLESNPRFSDYGDTVVANHLLFDFFCGLHAKKYFISESEIEKLKDLITERRRTFGYVFGHLDSSFGFIFRLLS
jgi:hypothetical protein